VSSAARNISRFRDIGAASEKQLCGIVGIELKAAESDGEHQMVGCSSIEDSEGE